MFFRFMQKGKIVEIVEVPSIANVTLVHFVEKGKSGPSSILNYAFYEEHILMSVRAVAILNF